MSHDEIDTSADEQSSRGGFRPGAGRPKGSKNRRTILTSELIDELRLARPDYNPLLSLVLMADEARGNDDLGLAKDCHATVLPYLMPKLRPIEADVEALQQLEVTKALLRKAVAEDWKQLPVENITRDFVMTMLEGAKERRIKALDEEVREEERGAEKAEQERDDGWLKTALDRGREIADLEDEALKDERRAVYKRQKAAEMRRERGLKVDDDDDDQVIEDKPSSFRDEPSDNHTPSTYDEDREAWHQQPEEPEPEEEPAPEPRQKPKVTYRAAEQSEDYVPPQPRDRDYNPYE
ncbi:MAG: hypothetical protein RIC87_15535 [Kiloniellales bacterium]